MIRVDDLLKARDTISRLFLRRRDTAKKAATKSEWSAALERNDQAYFMLVFGRFEEHVNAECKTLIAAKQAAPNLLDRRCWDTLDIDKLEFMRKIALLTMKGHREYNRAYDIFQTVPEQHRAW